MRAPPGALTSLDSPQTEAYGRARYRTLSRHPSLLAAEEHEVTIVGRSPWYLAWRRLRRNYFALFSLLVFILIVTACFLAPVYAHRIAHTGPNETHSAETVIVSGVPTKVISGGATYDAKTGNFTVRAVKILGPTGGTPTGSSSSAPTTSAATWPCGCSTEASTR